LSYSNADAHQHNQAGGDDATAGEQGNMGTGENELQGAVLCDGIACLLGRDAF
jgi:hypothetical protein